MKSLELKPTYENLLETLKNDTISRNESIFHFVNILNAIDDSCSIALDGGWGSGKTFFVQQVKLVLESYNDFIGFNDKNDKESLRELYSRFSKAQEIEPQMCVYYDAWENDNDDPMMSLVYSIVKSVEECEGLENNVNISKAAAAILEFFMGKRWSNLVESLEGDSPLKDIIASNSAEERVKATPHNYCFRLFLRFLQIFRISASSLSRRIMRFAQNAGIKPCFVDFP